MGGRPAAPDRFASPRRSRATPGSIAPAGGRCWRWPASTAVAVPASATATAAMPKSRRQPAVRALGRSARAPITATSTKNERALASCATMPTSAEPRAARWRAGAIRCSTPAWTHTARAAWHAARGSAQLGGDSLAALWHLAQAGDTAGVTRAAATQRSSWLAMPRPIRSSRPWRPRRRRPRAPSCSSRAPAWRACATPPTSWPATNRRCAWRPRPTMRCCWASSTARSASSTSRATSTAPSPTTRDSVECLRRSGLGDDAGAAVEVIEGTWPAGAPRLAHALRNDPRAMALLERAQSVAGRYSLSPATLAMLEQTWGECLRPRRRPAARSSTNTARCCCTNASTTARPSSRPMRNLSLIYGEARDFARARLRAARAALAETMAVEPEILASTHINLGVAWFWQSDFAGSRAIPAGAGHRHAPSPAPRRRHRAPQPRRGLLHALQADRRSGRRSARRRHAAAAICRGTATGAQRGRPPIKPRSSAPVRIARATACCQRSRRALRRGRRSAAPARALAAGRAAKHVRAHLAIARAYLAIAMKEREAALADRKRHALGDGFVAEFDAPAPHLRARADARAEARRRLARDHRRPAQPAAAAPCWRSCWPRVRSTRAAMRSCAR